MPFVEVYDLPRALTYQVEVTDYVAAKAKADSCTVTEVANPRLPIVSYEQFKAGDLPDGSDYEPWHGT